MKTKVLAAVGLSTVLLFSCKKEEEVKPIEVNASGTVYYLHPTDNSAGYAWADEYIVTGAASLTNGQQNTDSVNAQTGTYAAKICSQLTAFGHDDWYLPSKDELVAISLNLEDKSSFVKPMYWSSSENNVDVAWAIHVESGNTALHSKSILNACRCIRK